ncbi:MAG: uridylate kinase [Proteobacteria bacterium]|nr:uridylate kinase [Pseudomonadota bacterium]
MAERAARGDRPLVIKVGGSLAETGRLASVLAMVCAARIPVVIVPGGGPFADAVRTLQTELQFDDAVAHRLAMLAMEQMAEFIVSEHSRMRVARSFDDISDAVMDGQIPVWAPLQMIGDDESISPSWSATSDSLSARLAEILAARLVLLKSVNVVRGATADELARSGVIDPFFSKIASRAGISWTVFGPDDDAALSALLADEGNA